MAAYAALISLEHIIHNLQHHSRPPISLHKEQVHLLTQKLTFLQEFLQVYNPNIGYSKEADPLEGRIAVVAYAAEDAIESHIFELFTNNDGENTSFDSLYEALEKMIEDMAVIKKEAVAIKETLEFKNQLHKKSRTPADFSGTSSFSSSLIVQKKSMVVDVDDLLLEMKDKLTSNRADLLTLPIVGMGGSGKTTLALNIFQDRLIEEHFDIRAWVTISQEYNISEILIQLLTQVIKEFNKELSAGELAEMLHKHLYGEKYMIVLDDMYGEKYNKKGSRVVITTRLITLASILPNSDSLVMKLLDEDGSWDWLSKMVFGGKACCPSEFEDIGKRIGKSCKGLPLSIVVVGGLLAKSEQSIEYWEHMEENLNAIVNLDDDECCLKTLFMSYKQLPVHLKSCSLYMGIYREDHVICTSKLVRLWVAEGFLKSINGRRPEDVARAYLKDLIDRNLILVQEVGSIGSIKKCKVHDLLRDLCLREARKEGFYTICPGQEIEDDVDRIVISDTIPEIEEVYSLSSAAPRAHSLILKQHNELTPQILRLMRILGCSYERSGDFQLNVQQLVNLRFFNFILEGNEFPS